MKRLIIVFLFLTIPVICFSGMIIQKFSSETAVTTTLIIDNDMITDNDIIIN